ncbi:hypothetical protein JRO89_XS05G0112800 [Xanthoceras sorbifolium]|uniref:Jacalin-type lectin domain-containing protein n=1 Tax=Xanthoceras sorbifolium TaxID=99658 RepID=A0ABQ8I1I7_9ROSI|nr:hypothetical protein JRO89_XS05G0112800 [Xanthoceras sorbifolium]
MSLKPGFDGVGVTRHHVVVVSGGSSKGTIKLGSWGGPGGFAWDFNLVTGQIVSSGTHGGTGGISDKISIDGSEEHLTLISGTVFDYFGTGNLIVQSLTFHTYKISYGPYGLTNGSIFKIPMENGEIIGFFGRAGAFVDSIGSSVLQCHNGKLV